LDVALAVSTKKDAPAWENGALIGIIVLALLVVFAVGLTRWHKNDLGSSLSMPDRLSGGYQAIELTSYDQFPKAQQAQLSKTQFETQLATIKKAQTTESSALTNAFGFAVQSQTYLSSDLKSSLSVIAYRGPGGVFGNGRNLTDSQTGNPGTGSMQKVGDTICYVDTGSQAQQSSPQAECQRSSANLTVQVTSSDGQAASASKYADEIYGSLGR